MLIEFSLSNMRSYADEQTISLVASRLDKKKGAIFSTGGVFSVALLSTAIILGKNGSGKSTLIKALDFVSDFVRDSSSQVQEEDAIPYSPYKFDADSEGKDTSFRLLFSVQENVYEFEFSINAERVTRESLRVADRSPKFRRLYDREWNGSEEIYSFSEELRGNKIVWRDATKRNSLFLSTANQLKSESLKAPYDWIVRYIRCIDASRESYEQVTAGYCSKESGKGKVIALLNGLDIDIEDIQIEEKEFDEASLRPMFTDEFIAKTLSKVKRKEVSFLHRGSNDRLIPISLDDESSGTNALFSIAGPLFDSLEKGYCLVVDEVNTSLHPLVVRTLIEAFCDPQINRRRAQLIFTTHDVSLLKERYLRRDSIWFVNKDMEGRSSLEPLSDYSPRKGEALDKGYLTGRYGGVPSIKPMLALIREIVGN